MPALIRRTYNVHGEHDFLIRLEGNCPVWCGAKAQAVQFDCLGSAAIALDVISTYRDQFCEPDGIQGVEVVVTGADARRFQQQGL